MRKPILAAVLAVLLVLLLALSGITLAKWAAAYQELKTEAKNLRAERDLLLTKVETAEQLAGHLVARSASSNSELPAMTLELRPAENLPTNSVSLWAVRPDITTDARGKKTYFFGELYG